MIQKFLDTFRTSATATIIFLQLIGVSLISIVLWQLLAHEGDASTIIIFTVVAVALTEVILAILTIKILSRPIDVITQAVLHVSTEISDTPPPNVNNWRDERSGLKALVQTIYELAASQSQALPSREEFALPLLEKLPVAVLVFDRKEELLFANEAGEQFFPGAPKNKRPTLEETHLFFAGSDTLTGWLADCRKNKIKDVRTWQRIPNQAPGEENRKIYDVVAHYNKHESHNIEVTLVIIDRTEEYHAADESMDFIALAAHELRGPITVIRGYLDVFEDDFADQLNSDDHKLLMERLKVSASQLSGYINNILNVARYDRNHLDLHLREENWSQLVHNYLPDLLMRAHAHNRRIVVDIPDDLPNVAADAISLQEVVTNLIDNAIKYSDEGSEITVKAYQDGDFIETTVLDTGIGIPQSVMGRLFTKFYRSHRSRQAVSGTGLGLYLCKAIVESHGGTIWVRSIEEEGTTFGFRLPTFESVAAKLKNDDNSNQQMIVKGSHGWIKNHSYYRR